MLPLEEGTVLDSYILVLVEGQLIVLVVDFLFFLEVLAALFFLLFLKEGVWAFAVQLFLLEGVLLLLVLVVLVFLFAVEPNGTFFLHFVDILEHFDYNYYYFLYCVVFYLLQQHNSRSFLTLRILPSKKAPGSFLLNFINLFCNILYLNNKIIIIIINVFFHFYYKFI